MNKILLNKFKVVWDSLHEFFNLASYFIGKAIIFLFTEINQDFNHFVIDIR